MAARDMGAALRKASSPSRSRVPVYRSEALSSMEAARQGPDSRAKRPDSPENPKRFRTKACPDLIRGGYRFAQ